MNEKKKILLIEDEENIRELVTFNLETNNYKIVSADDGIKGMAMVYTERPDLILLDIMLPGKDGFEICKELRAEDIKIPIIMLTAKTEEIDKVLGLELGADDYISKPFSLRELIARIKAVLRRLPVESDFHDVQNKKPSVRDKIEVGELVIDISRFEVESRGQKINLTVKEFDLLVFLVKNRGEVFTRDQLWNEVWGLGFMGESRTVDVHIRHLRKKLNLQENDRGHIETVRGMGYRFK